VVTLQLKRMEDLESGIEELRYLHTLPGIVKAVKSIRIQ